MTAHLAASLCCAYVHAYLCVKWLVDVHSVVLALFDEHAPTFPDESRWRVGVDGAAQEHGLLLVVTTAHIANGLVHCQNWCVKVCKNTAQQQKYKHEDSDFAAGGAYCLLQPKSFIIKGLLSHIQKFTEYSFIKAQILQSMSG